MKIIDCNREQSSTLGSEGAAGQRVEPNTAIDASASDRDRSIWAIVLQSALAALAFYAVAHLFYLYIDRWSDLDVEVIVLPTFEELDRSFSDQRVQFSANPPVIDSPWRPIYEAASFSEAIRIVEQANACSTPDAQAFLARARRVCEYLAPNLPKDRDKKSESEREDESRPASWSIFLTMYFQDRYCAGYEVGAEQQCRDVGGSVHDGFASGDDEVCFETAGRHRGFIDSLDGPSRGGLLYVEISDRTISPELYFGSVSGISIFERAGVLEANDLTERMGLDEIDSAQRAASMIAMCDIYGVCPPLGLVVMSECIPYRCPVDGGIRSYFRRVSSPEVEELYDLWSSELVSRRQISVR